MNAVDRPAADLMMLDLKREVERHVGPGDVPIGKYDFHAALVKTALAHESAPVAIRTRTVGSLRRVLQKYEGQSIPRTRLMGVVENVMNSIHIPIVPLKSFNDLQQFDRIGVVGGPRTGKTTVAGVIAGNRQVLHTDDSIGVPWADQPAFWMRRTRGKSQFVLEGVQTARAIRAGLKVDVVLWMTQPRVELTAGQLSMLKSTHTIIEGIDFDCPVFEYNHRTSDVRH